MSQQIGDALVSAIEQVDISASSSSSEINLTDLDKQFLVDGENQGEDIEITFYIIGEEFDSIEDIEDQVKSLTSNPVNKNVLDYQDNKGFISVDSVSIPESSSTQNLRQGSISGKFLSFPQNFPQESFIVLISSTANFDNKISGEISSIKSVTSDIGGKLDSFGQLFVSKLLEADFESYFVLGGGDEYNDGEYGSKLYGRKYAPISSERAFESDLYFSLAVDGVFSSERAFEGSLDSTLEIQSGLYGFNYGNSYSSEEPVLSFVLSISGSTDGELQADGTLEDITEISYGYDYGSDYGGYMTDYGANIYGRNTYNN